MAWNFGTVGRRLPFSMPETTLVVPSSAVEVRVDPSSESAGIGEQAVEDLAAVLLVVVPAGARRQIDPFAGGPGDLEERRRLLELVVQVGVEELVGDRAEGARGGNLAHGFEAGDRQALAVVPFAAAVEQAENPVGVLVPTGQPQLLGQAGGGRRVDQGSIQGVDRLRKADRGAGDASVEGGRVAYDEHVAVRRRRDRGEGVPVVEVDLDLQIGKQELVGGWLLELGEELALAKVHGGGGSSCTDWRPGSARVRGSAR